MERHALATDLHMDVPAGGSRRRAHHRCTGRPVYAGPGWGGVRAPRVPGDRHPSRQDLEGDAR